MKYLMLFIFGLNVYFAFKGYTVNAFVAGYMLSDLIRLVDLRANT